MGCNHGLERWHGIWIEEGFENVGWHDKKGDEKFCFDLTKQRITQLIDKNWEVKVEHTY